MTVGAVWRNGWASCIEGGRQGTGIAGEREMGQGDKMKVQETAKGRCEWHGSMGKGVRCVSSGCGGSKVRCDGGRERRQGT